MTENHDFKQRVRERMTQTGQPYTAARADLVAAQAELRSAAAAEQASVVGRFFDGETLRSVPTKRKVRAAVMLELVARFAPGRDYTEPEVNEILRRAHDDYAYLRRELVNYGYVGRDHGNYRLAARAPQRDAFYADELPAWEGIWLPGFLAGTRPHPRASS